MFQAPLGDLDRPPGISALNPIIAYHHGAGSEAAVGASYVQGLWLALLVSAVGCPVLRARRRSQACASA